MLAWRNLTRRRARSLLTVFGVAVGIASVVAVVSVARGLREQFNGFFDAGNAHLVLTRRGASDPFISHLPDDMLTDLAAHPGVGEVHPFLFWAYQLPTYPLLFFYGATPGSPALAQISMLDGPGLFAADAPPREIVLGKATAATLELSVGSTMTLGDDEFRVTGIYESIVPLLNAGCVLPFPDAQRVSGLEGKMSSALVHLVVFDEASVTAGERSLEAAFPIVEATSAAAFSNAFDEFDLADQAVSVFTLLAVIVGGLGVMNTMLMSVFERTREIGVLQAVGWSKSMVLQQILLEGLIVSIIGGPVGIVLGIATVESIGSIGTFAWISGTYDADVIAKAMMVSVGMGAVGAVYPALRAVRITPIEALRYE